MPDIIGPFSRHAYTLVPIVVAAVAVVCLHKNKTVTNEVNHRKCNITYTKDYKEKATNHAHKVLQVETYKPMTLFPVLL